VTALPISALPPLLIAGATSAAVAFAGRTDVPIDLPRDEARRKAREELAKPIYHRDDPSLAVRILRWVLDRIGGLLDRASAVSPGGWFGIIGLVVVILIIVVAIRLKVGPFGRTSGRAALLFVGGELTADRHRAKADELAAQGDWQGAVLERFRAVVRTLEERGLIDPRPGRTADEAAAEGGRALSSAASALNAGARVFDDVTYGGRTATPEHDALLRRLDDSVRSSRAGVMV
jgi:hypothetical protein